MNVNVKLTITDEQRNQLAKVIDNTETKRLATRKDVNGFVQGCIDAALSEKRVCVWDDWLEEMQKENRSESYIRGVRQVYDRYFI